MSAEGPGDGANQSNVDELYRAFRQRIEAGEELDLESLVARYPEHENALRLLHLAHDEEARDEDDAQMHALLRDGLAVGSSINARSIDARTIDPEAEIPSASGRRYTIRREIARGGMGRILEVWDEDLRRPLAMKVVRKHRRGSRSGSTPQVSRSVLDRFFNEARLTGQIDHPGVVPVHEIGVDSAGHVFFTMPLVRGRDLQSVIELAGSGREGWTQARILNALVRVCETMSYAHSKGFIHRDLKPANIMVGPFGEIYVMDWGLAKACDQKDTRDLRLVNVDLPEARRVDGDAAKPVKSLLMTLDGTVLGTPAFMSPEQAQGHLDALGRRSDIYSLGAILYSILTGNQPYVDPGDSPSSRQILDAVAKGPPRPVLSIRRDVPAELVAICEKAMARDPSRRYATADELTEDLRAFLENRVVRAHRTGPSAKLGKWLIRNRGMATSIAAAAILIISGLVAFVFWQEGARRDLTRAVAEKDEALDAQAKALEQAEGHRLTAHSSAVLTKNPALALLLAIEGARRAPGPAADNALGAAIASVREIRCFDHEGKTGCASFSPDGRHLGVTLDDGTARIWDLETGRQVMALIGHQRALNFIDFSHDGQRVATTSWDGTVRIWEVGTGRELLSLTAHQSARRHGSYIRTVRFHPDGTHIVTACRDDATARIFDLERGTNMILGDRILPSSASFTADGLGAVTASNSGRPAIRLWHTRTGELIDTIPAGRYEFWFASLDPIGGLVAAACSDNRLRIWEGFGGREMHVIRMDDIQRVRFNPDGRKVLCNGEKGVRIFDARSGIELASLDGHRGRVPHARFNRDGKLVATTSTDRTARIWAGSTRPSTDELRSPGRSAVTAFSPDGARVVTAIENWKARIWQVATGEPIVDLEGHQQDVLTASFSTDGERVITASRDRTARIWDSRAGTELHLLRGHRGELESAVFSADGLLAVTASHDNTARLWDTASGEPLRVFTGHGNWVLCAALSPSGDRVATSAIDGARIWETATGKEIVRLHGVAASDWISFSPDGNRTLAARFPRNIGVISDARTGHLLQSLHGHDGHIEFASFSPGGDRAVTLSEDGSARVWRVSDGKEVAEFRAREGDFQHASFSSDGHYLLTVTPGGLVRAWSLDQSHDLLTQALRKKPRELTPEERDRYLVGTPEERDAYRSEWTRALHQETVRAFKRALAADPDNADKWRALARVHNRAGEIHDTIRCLERVLRLPYGEDIRGGLERFREMVRPDLVTYASIDAAIASSGVDATRLEAFRTYATLEVVNGTRDHHLAYIEGRQLQQLGRDVDALEHFETAAASDPRRPESVLHIAECLRQLGDASAAEGRIRSAIEESVEEARLLWDAWFALSAVELGRDAVRLRESMPRVPPGSDGRDRRDDMWWLLERLGSTEPIRINCGGRAKTARAGALWGEDRFFTAGYGDPGEPNTSVREPRSRQESGVARAVGMASMIGLGPDTPYVSERRFPKGSPHAPGYRIPLPTGQYRVALLFAAAFRPAEQTREFDIHLESQIVLKRYGRGRGGIAAADRKEFTLRVEDGFLDIVLTRRSSSDPAISGIEIALARPTKSL